MAMKEICIDCLCLQLQLINDHSENPAKVRELVEELLSEYDDLRQTPRAADALPQCEKCGSSFLWLNDGSAVCVNPECGNRR